VTAVQPSLVALESELSRLMENFPAIVCFGNDIEGDPTSKHHIMRILANYVPVYWVESAGMRWPRLTSISDLRRIAHRLHRAAVPPRSANLTVLSPVSIPLPGNPIAEKINGWIYRRKIRAAVQRERRPPLLWVYIPTVAPYLKGMPNSGVVYHCVDRWWAFSEYDRDVMRRHHASLCTRAKSVFASATELRTDCEQFTDNVHLLPHGVEWEHFSKAALGNLEIPEDVRDLRKPVIGFFGLLHDWIDQRLLKAVARACPEATLLLIGKARVDLSELLQEPNVRWIGQKPYEQLPAYAAIFDVALVPFVLNELTAAVNPLKLREYLATGIPVVSTALPEIVALEGRPGVTIGRTEEAFVAAVRQAIARPATRAERESAADREVSESWLGRCVQMVRWLGEDLPALRSTAHETAV
jgi:glycosyltransferase involved in cell wall biosynthesis